MKTRFASRLIRVILASSAAALCIIPNATAFAQDITAYPAAAAGQKRVSLTLPPLEHEKDMRVEIVIGKTMWLRCNMPVLRGDLEKKTTWSQSYPYYQMINVSESGPTPPLLGCPSQPPRETLVPASGAGYLLKYNSRFPIVVYAPDTFEVHYRLWRSASEILPVTPTADTSRAPF